MSPVTHIFGMSRKSLSFSCEYGAVIKHAKCELKLDIDSAE